jgi:hypothetical protein
MPVLLRDVPDRFLRLGPGKFMPWLRDDFLTAVNEGRAEIPRVAELESLIKWNADSQSYDFRGWQRRVVTMLREPANMNRGLPQPFVLMMRWLGFSPIDFCPSGFVPEDNRLLSRERSDGMVEITAVWYKADQDGYVHHLSTVGGVAPKDKARRVIDKLLSGATAA